MPTKHAGAQKHFGDVAPKLAEISGDVLYNDVWERPGLSKRDRCMITVASLITGYRTHQLPFHIKKALDHGVTRQELAERSEEHTSELQSLMRNSYPVFCLKQKNSDHK